MKDMTEKIIDSPFPYVVLGAAILLIGIGSAGTSVSMQELKKQTDGLEKRIVQLECKVASLESMKTEGK